MSLLQRNNIKNESLAEQITAKYDDPWDHNFRRFRSEILNQYPERFAEVFAEKYICIYETQGRQKANLFLLDLKEELTSPRLSLTATDRDIRNYAQSKADEFKRLYKVHQNSANIVQLLCDIVYERYGIHPPLKKLSLRDTLTDPDIVEVVIPETEGRVKVIVKVNGVIGRLCDEKWWRRSLRNVHMRNVEANAIKLGLVRCGKDQYVSNESLQRVKQQKLRSKTILENCIATNETGQEYTLQQLSDVSVSNPTNQRNELMTRLAGLDATALMLGLTGLAITITCPSRMHRSITLKNKKNSILNPNYADITPTEAQKYLNRVWAMIRAKLDRLGIKVFGFRVTEPHQDGTPHWHVLLYTEGKNVKTLKKVIRDYALQDSPYENGAQTRRVNIIMIDRKKGSGVSYLAKYIAKNIDGFKFDDLVDGMEANTAAQRTKAWASTWGIRQFQFLGGPSVTIWREIRRITDNALNGLPKEVWEAANDAKWDKFVLLMGGFDAKRKAFPISLAKQWNDKLNNYQEAKGLEIIGIAHGNVTIPTRLHQWIVCYRPNFNQVHIRAINENLPISNSLHEHSNIEYPKNEFEF